MLELLSWIWVFTDNGITPLAFFILLSGLFGSLNSIIQLFDLIFQLLVLLQLFFNLSFLTRQLVDKVFLIVMTLLEQFSEFKLLTGKVLLKVDQSLLFVINFIF